MSGFEVGGLALGAIGVVGVAGLYSTCLQMLDQLDTARHMDQSAEPLVARLAATKHLFRSWGQQNGIQDDGVLGAQHNPAFDDTSPSSIRIPILLLLASIETLMSDHRALNEKYGLFFIPPFDTALSSISDLKEEMSKLALNAPKKGWKLKAKWAITGRNKFSSLVGEVEAIVDRLFTLTSPRLENIAEQQKELVHRYDDAERMSILEWLQPVYTATEYDEAVIARTPGTCNWILELPLFQIWSARTESRQVLWINGGAGFGKTFLSAKIVEHFTTTSSHPLAYFFCVHYEIDKKNPLSILRSFIAQIAARSPEALRIVKTHKEKEIRSPTVSELWVMFRSIISKVPFCRFIIDGYDECFREAPTPSAHLSGVRLRFLKDLLEALSISSDATVLIVCRDEIDIREALVQSSENNFLEFTISENDNQEDIEAFARVATLKSLSRHSSDVQDEIISGLCSKAKGMFLWLRMEQGRLRSTQTAEQLRKIISSKPSGVRLLNHVYERSIQAILNLEYPEDTERAINILRWAVYAEKPLTVRELSEALIAQTSPEEFPDALPSNIDQEYIQQTILSLCGSLVLVRDPHNIGDEESGQGYCTIHLAHFSVKEYLLSSNGAVGRLEDPIHNHSQLAIACLNYLSLSHFSHSPLSTNNEDLETRLKGYAFLEYSALIWPTHTRLVTYDDPCLEKALAFLHSNRSHYTWDSWRQVYHALNAEGGKHWNNYVSEQGSVLYYCAHFGILPLVQTLLLDQKVDANATGGHRYGSALQVASYFGWEAIVRLLIDCGADVNALPGYYGSALHAASENGYEGIVRLLIDNGADVNAISPRFGSPLQGVAEKGHLTIAQVLIDSGAGVNARGERSVTALYAASEHGYEALVRFLIGKGADVNAPSKQFGSALQGASMKGHETIVRLLIENGADIEASGEPYNRSALRIASERGHDAIMQVLIDNGADIGVLQQQYDDEVSYTWLRLKQFRGFHY